MKTKYFMKIKILGFSICMIFVMSLYAQDKEIIETSNKSTTSLKKVVKNEGWEIPHFEESELVRQETVNIQDRPIVLKQYKLRKSNGTQLDFYSLGEDGNLTVKSWNVEVRYITSFTLGEKKFAYQINHVPYGVSDKGRKEYFAVMITVYYFDEDGDGVFETMYPTKRTLDFLPNWLIK